MEVKFIISSISIGFGKTGFGANAMTGAYIQTRVQKGAPVETYGITSTLTIGSDSSTIIVGHVSSEWFVVDKEAEKILLNKSNLLGKRAELESSGTLLFSGKTDVKLTVYNNIGKGTTVFDLIDIPSSGGQLSSTKIRGVLKGLPSATTQNQAVSP